MRSSHQFFITLLIIITIFGCTISTYQNNTALNNFAVLAEAGGNMPMGVRAGNNSDPFLTEPSAYQEDDHFTFEVNYTDLDGDEGTVLVYLDDEEPLQLRSGEFDPTDGQYYHVQVPESEVDDYTEFYFTADDNNGSTITLKDISGSPFLVGDFDGWGDAPELSEPDVYFDGDDWVFNVSYWDPDGDEAEYVLLYIDNLNEIYMETDDPDPLEGQEYFTYVLEDKVDEYSEFHFAANDLNGSYTGFYDDDWENFIVGDFLDSNDTSDGDGDGGGDGDGENNGDDDSGFGFVLPGRWGDPEVIIGIIALVGMAVGSIVGIWLRKKKRKRFSALLCKIDDVYGSYKMHPRKCETELEKIKTEVDSDLKDSVIDENNYTILKERINEITQEIRSESVRSRVGDLPKDIELRIKDMLIDGRITRKEYNKFMKTLKGSDMTSADKKEMENLILTWMKEDKGK